ncbi:autotransporter assembly complex protein TamA [Propionivibrio sp.]|uniref:autotransporter assembly complex protein TamA n=1 Tax=Propionivibrio sp. TaxID=2212460 RepID=UPI003BF249D3
MHKRLQMFALGMVATLFLATPAFAALQLVAPSAVHDLLLSHLPLGGPEGEPQDATARSTLERRLIKEAGGLLATEGYFSPLVELRDIDGGLVLQVEPGLRAHIGSVNIEIRGALAAERRQKLIDDWGLPSAAPFRQAAWVSAKQGLLRELMAVDHAGARLLSSQAEVDVEAARVDLHLVYDAGPRYRYGEIRIVGLQRYPASLVKLYSAPLHPGQAFRQEDLLAVQTALQNTPYFSSVSVELERSALTTDEDGVAPATPMAEPAGEELRVPVIISLRERAPFRISLGAGYSSNTGARVEGNFRNADLFGRAWELNTGARIEQLRQSAYADIFLPPDRLQRRVSVGALVEKSDIQGLGIERVAFAAARVQFRGSIEQRLGLNWQHERQSPEGAPSSTNRALTATAGWVWRHAEDPLDASEGIVAQLQLGGATKAVLSDQNFLRTYFRYSQGIPLGKSDGLLFRGELGVTAAPSRQGIPQDYLFRAGGSNSVRGYAYQSLGVQEGSATLGGRYLVTVSAEYTHWLDAKWGIAVFADAGQAADDREVLKLAPGYGAGARWKSPAGPLAIDLAWGQLDKELRLHFSLAVPF